MLVVSISLLPVFSNILLYGLLSTSFINFDISLLLSILFAIFKRVTPHPLTTPYLYELIAVLRASSILNFLYFFLLFLKDVYLIKSTI